MVKINTINRSADDYVPIKSTQESALPRNLNPELHAFERAREYTKALQATKLERMFAKPFIGQLGYGHRDGVYHIAKNYHILNQISTGDGEGIIKFWNLNDRTEKLSYKAHYGLVTGLSMTPQLLGSAAGMLISCGDDKTIKLWDVDSLNNGLTSSKFSEKVEKDTRNEIGLVKTFYGETAFQSLDCHRDKAQFITGGPTIQLWDCNRSKPLSDLSWGCDTVTHVKFNQVEKDILCSTGTDNSIVLYDLRTNSPTQKLVQTMRTNAICWNPMEAFNFVVANEDHNCYYYDMRKLSRALNVFKDHVSAVMDVDFSPTGEEIVTGSYDKTIRIYNVRQGHSRDVYHTKRMQRVFQVKYTMDSKYIVSGSDDGNVRLWRGVSWERSNVKTSKEKSKLEYDEKLKEKFKYMPEIRRIGRHRHVPKVIKKAGEIKKVELDSLRRREMNERKTRKDMAFVPERKKQIVGQVFKYENEDTDRKYKEEKDELED
ncbi:probable Protein SOF1 [Saccharomycodes ludwigii]|uniref:DDB1- and CUL4-associated factor 13 n=1 Tax=Saccharomycodes ludwigii TaxID=36035 RepID=A0A376B3C6_9ASCO|nr:hypothetical protein SCDLUD_004792 [Saccharomycodes ludwigii]KAH3899352.1 hypothetical protein SCDLUD_004792 [Saccharomycodes ludwigii]SSD58630.1 probable Protein SOF1 [Saccharomycodes ludwigii]